MFTKKTLDFLSENRFMNSKEWFSEHKEDYNKYVLEPLAELAKALAPTLTAIDRQIITEPKVDKTISRIYRDLRFAKDKLLYREEMWLSIKRDKKEFPGYPEFFFVVSPYGFLYGCGYYSTSAETMNTIRELILTGDPMFLKALEAYENQSDLILDGDSFKKSRYPDQPERIRSWLDKKTICFMRKSHDFPLLFSDVLAPYLINSFKSMEPVYKFLVYAEEKSREK